MLRSRLAGEDAAWTMFCAAPPPTIRVEDVPWPDFSVIRRQCEDDVDRVSNGDDFVPPSGTVDFQALVTRWNPQHFRTRFAACLVGSDGARVVRRVSEVAGLLDAEWRKHVERLRRARDGLPSDDDIQ
jgi:hypothetical protein